MRMTRTLLMTASLIVLTSLPALAVQVYTSTRTAQVHRPGVEYLDFSALDKNHDGVLSANEVGDTLFYLFDSDGNEVLDNIEFEQGKVYTVEPMQTATLIQADLNDDGIIDATKYTTDRFMQVTRLDRLNSGNGAKMSPHDFIKQSFLELDDNKDGTIRLEEWEEAYNKNLTYAVNEQERYNN